MYRQAVQVDSRRHTFDESAPLSGIAKAQKVNTRHRPIFLPHFYLDRRIIMPSNDFRVEIASEEDIPSIVNLIVPSFSFVPVERLLGNIEDAEAIKESTKRHLRSVREHKEATGVSPAIKCVHTDAAGKETIVACGYWFIYPKPRSEQELQKPIYLLSADWVSQEDGQREKARKVLQPTIDTRIKWTRGRGIGLLMYMTTAPSWRRNGAATACVQWGIDRCRELGIPAYLEASEEGKPVYEKLGFEVVDHAALEMDGTQIVFPVMMLWPPGTREEEKRPLIG